MRVMWEALNKGLDRNADGRRRLLSMRLAIIISPSEKSPSNREIYMPAETVTMGATANLGTAAANEAHCAQQNPCQLSPLPFTVCEGSSPKAAR